MRSPGAMALRPGATFTRIFASWDGTWYELIVREGYPSVIPARARRPASNAGWS